jgi:tetratricopeptide (TPR) repeat protein
MPDAPSHVQTAIAQCQLGHFEDALSHAELAIRERQAGVTPYLCAAYAAGKLSGNASALVWLDRALVADPASCLALGARANLLRTENRAAEGLDNCRQWIALEPNNGFAHLALARSYQALGRDEQAVEAYGRAIEFLPQPAETLTDLSILLLELGRHEAARKALDRALGVDGAFAAAWYTRADTKHFAPDDPDVDAMERLLDQSSRQTEPRAIRDTILFHYALAKAYTDLKDVPRALSHLESGSRLKRAEFNYDPAADERRMAAIAAAFPADYFEHRRGVGDPSELPVFIVGMPRSGTSLVEQILASHPQIRGGGETANLEKVIQGLGAAYPGGMQQLDPERTALAARQYLDLLSAPQAPVVRVTDKMTDNFLHLGLIHAMFPRARIIHCIRDPLDTCVSCYSKLFTKGQEFSYDLGELGRYYRSYAALMAHWRALIPPECFIEIEYEKVVDDLENEARRLIEFCGLPWSEACMRFHETSRTVRTASMQQVRQPLYRRSVGRAATLGSRLTPLVEALDGRQPIPSTLIAPRV